MAAPVGRRKRLGTTSTSGENSQTLGLRMLSNQLSSTVGVVQRYPQYAPQASGKGAGSTGFPLHKRPEIT